MHKAKSDPAAIEESAADREELDAVAQAADELIDGGKLCCETLQEALLLRAVLQVRVREPWHALATLEALLAAQGCHNSKASVATRTSEAGAASKAAL
ncbi:MAG TPA: hypothetical protein VND64_34180 [Pirellulales bacterium]|nr:hypothetical protein [Pirellulales bacterium]